MATMYDDRRKIKTSSTDPAALEAIMVNDLMSATKHRPANLRRYCESSVRAAIRRNGRTDAQQRLVMNDDERAAWETANPLPE